MSKSLVQTYADKLGVDDTKLLKTLKETAFKQPSKKNNNGEWVPQEITNEQMMALLVVANQYNLNPFTKEIYAFPDKKNGIVPIVGVDGWARIINENKNFNGMQFNESDEIIKSQEHKDCPSWMECIIYRKDREHPVSVKEYFDEVYRPPFTGKDYKTKNEYTKNGPWQTHTKRMLRHKAMIQCSRLAFAYVGIYDKDEGERIIEAEVIREGPMEESTNHRWKPGEKDEIYKQVTGCLINDDAEGLKQIQNELEGDVEQMKFWGLFNSEQKAAIKLLGKD